MSTETLESRAVRRQVAEEKEEEDNDGTVTEMVAAATTEEATATATSTSPPPEPLLVGDGSARFVLFPIQHRNVWTLYKKAEASFWTVEEVPLTEDLAGWGRLNAAEQHFIKTVLAFFAASDGIVMENLAVRFYNDVKIPEVRAFYGLQMAVEGIHSEMYSTLIEAYIQDRQEQARLLGALETVPAIAHKGQWATQYIASTASFATRLVAFAVVEGVFFSGSFCAIFWLTQVRGVAMPGLKLSNELISRDEGMHCDFACLLYQEHLQQRLTDAEVHALVREAVAIETEYIQEALQVALVGMNAADMATYVQFVADRLLVNLGHPRLYGVKNPFPWMGALSLAPKTNFFEKRVGAYALAGVKHSNAHHADSDTLRPLDDF